MTKLKFIYAQVNIYAINLHLIAFVKSEQHKRPRHAKMPQNIGQNQIKFESDEHEMTTIKYTSNVRKMYEISGISGFINY